MHSLPKAIFHNRIARFAAVGVFNTLFDLVMFNVFMLLLGEPDNKTVVIISNSISATIAAVVSFFINRRYVFHAQHTPNHYALRFIAITLTGLYLIQSLIIYLALHAFDPLAELGTDVLHALGMTGVGQDWVLANVAKVFATLGSMVWNYTWYSRSVFKPAAKQ